MDRHVSQVLASPPQRWILEVDERLPPSARVRHHVPVLPTRPQDYMRRYRGTSLIRDGTLSQEHYTALGIVPLKGPTEEQFFCDQGVLRPVPACVLTFLCCHGSKRRERRVCVTPIKSQNLYRE